MAGKSHVRVVLPSRHARITFRLPRNASKEAKLAVAGILEDALGVYKATCSDSGQVSLLLNVGVNSKQEVARLVKNIRAVLEDNLEITLGGKIEFDGE